MVSRFSGPSGELMAWSGKRVLVTGATGFIGRRLVHRLAEVGAQVHAAALSPDKAKPAVGHSHSAVRRLVFDLRDAKAVQVAVTEAAPQIIFHLAAVGVTDPSVDPALALAVNVGGAVHLLESLREREVERVVLAGTCYEYGAAFEHEAQKASESNNRTVCFDPFNAYAASKVAAWAFGRMYWRAHGSPVVTMRPFQVYGPGQPSHTLTPAAIHAALTGDDFPMTLGEQKRDFIYVEDVVDGILAAAAAPGIEGQSLDLGTGRVHTVRQVVERIWALTGARGQMRPGALPYRSGAVMHLVADAERTARLTGWRAQVGLEEGLKRVIEDISKNV